MTRLNINQLNDLDPLDRHTFACIESTVRETKSGSMLCGGRMGDATGDLKFIRFNCETPPTPGQIYRVSGVVETYNSSLQLKLDSWEHVPADQVEDYTPFEQTSPIPIRRLAEDLEHYLESLGGDYGKVVRIIFHEDAFQKFLWVPASRMNHHAYRHGLAEHTLSMLRLSDSVFENYANFYGPEISIDIDLLRAGVLLHDFAKSLDFERDGMAWESTDASELTGHIVECCCLISDACTVAMVSEEVRQNLIHMVASHHGQIDFGSPVKPKLLEAVILHQLDMLDSRVAMVRGATRDLDAGEWSGWHRVLGRKIKA